LWAGKASPRPAARSRRIHTTSYLPDLNVWLALSRANHMHSEAAWAWFPRHEDDSFIFVPIHAARAAAASRHVRHYGQGCTNHPRSLDWCPIAGLRTRESPSGRSRLSSMRHSAPPVAGQSGSPPEAGPNGTEGALNSFVSNRRPKPHPSHLFLRFPSSRPNRLRNRWRAKSGLCNRGGFPL
jgi:hypothetical protein